MFLLMMRPRRGTRRSAATHDARRHTSQYATTRQFFVAPLRDLNGNVVYYVGAQCVIDKPVGEGEESEDEGEEDEESGK